MLLSCAGCLSRPPYYCCSIWPLVREIYPRESTKVLSFFTYHGSSLDTCCIISVSPPRPASGSYGNTMEEGGVWVSTLATFLVCTHSKETNCRRKRLWTMCVSFLSILVTVVVPPIKARLLASFAAYFFVPLNQPGSQDAANTGPFSFFFFFQCPTFSCGVCLHFLPRQRFSRPFPRRQ